jgi:chromosome segregation ATPase
MFAVAAVIFALVGYVGWALLRPDPYSVSERIVRDARRDVAAEVRDFQRDVDVATRDAKRDQKDVAAVIDGHRDETLKDIDEVVDSARDRLSQLDISLRTHRNRLDRIDSRAEEARHMVNELAAEAKQKSQGS